MPKSIPYILRRKDTLFFRIGVPKDLRQTIGCREILRSLQTSNRKEAEPFALELAAKAKRIFLRARYDMAKDNNSISTNYELEVSLNEFNKPKIKLKAEPHEADAANSALETAINSLNQSEGLSSPNKNKQLKTLPHENVTLSLSEVAEAFINKYNKTKNPAMYKKLQAVIPMFLEVVGNKYISELKQTDINHFFELIQKLPPRWKSVQTKEKVSIKKLANMSHDKTMAPKTFKSTYVACIRLFLKLAIKNYSDYGFPTHLTTSGTEYEGDREEGENKQRHFNTNELKRLFEGSKMKELAQTKSHAHYYWLPHIGLFTGARVNEICQLNPQTDIKQDPDTQIWYFWITEETEADERITKRTKNLVSRRKVPIHRKLLELGLLTYIERIKATGAKLIFPEWKPSRGKASSGAEKWFREFLKLTNLRDESPYKRVVGMHAFRSTFANKALNSGVDESSIIGHAGEGTSVERGYQGELSLLNKQKILDQINFDIEFIAPV